MKGELALLKEKIYAYLLKTNNSVRDGWISFDTINAKIDKKVRLINNNYCYTLEEIGQKYNISGPRIRMIREHGLNNLKLSLLRNDIIEYHNGYRSRW